MANIEISELRPAGSALFSDSESLMGSIRDLSENELKITGGDGGGKGRSKSKTKSKSKKKSGKKSRRSYCY